MDQTKSTVLVVVLLGSLAVLVGVTVASGLSHILFCFVFGFPSGSSMRIQLSHRILPVLAFLWSLTLFRNQLHYHALLSALFQLHLFPFSFILLRKLRSAVVFLHLL